MGVRLDDEISSATVWKWIWITVGAIAVITVASIVISTATSGVRGKAGVTRKNNDSNNQIAAQAEFERVWGDIQRDVGSLKIVTDADHRQQLQEVCLADVSTYNLDAQSTTLKDWRPSNLPSFIDADTECGIK